MMGNIARRCTIAAAGVALLVSSADAQGITQPKQGKGGSAIQGSAGTDGGRGDKDVEHCARPMGALAVVEPQDYILLSLRRYSLGSPTGLVRMMVQQSNCFVVVERGVGMQNMMQERELSAAGQVRENSNMGGGQMVSADFVLTPSVVFSEDDAGGVGAGVAGLFGRRAAAVGAVAGGLKFKEAQTSMLVADARTGVQVSAAQGSTRKADLRLGGGGFGGRLGVAAGGYGNTNEGKIIAAALLDNYNNVVRAIRNDPSLHRNVGTLKEEAALGGAKRSGAVFEDGDVLVPKIANVRLLAEPGESARVVSTLDRGEELVVIGPARDGYVNVQTAEATGWVRAVLVQLR